MTSPVMRPSPPAPSFADEFLPKRSARFGPLSVERRSEIAGCNERRRGAARRSDRPSQSDSSGGSGAEAFAASKQSKSDAFAQRAKPRRLWRAQRDQFAVRQVRSPRGGVSKQSKIYSSAPGAKPKHPSSGREIASVDRRVRAGAEEMRPALPTDDKGAPASPNEKASQSDSSAQRVSGEALVKFAAVKMAPGSTDRTQLILRQMDVNVDGRHVYTVHKAIPTTFAAAPDASVSRLTLNLDGAGKGPFENNTDIFEASLRVEVTMDGQNGETADQSPQPQAPCGSSKARRSQKRVSRVHNGRRAGR